MPMGSDPAPFFANLFLFFYEVQWIKSTKKLDYGRARRFLNTFRFIDDLIAANDYGVYDLGGNVSEWILDAYNLVATAKTWDLNPVYLDDEEPLKIIKGGSWKDIADRIRVDVVDYAHKDKRASYISFRRVMPHIGEEPLDK